MQLDSARSLKQALMDSVILSLTTPLHARKLGVPARPVAAVSTVPATIALGIVRRPLPTN